MRPPKAPEPRSSAPRMYRNTWGALLTRQRPGPCCWVVSLPQPQFTRSAMAPASPSPCPRVAPEEISHAGPPERRPSNLEAVFGSAVQMHGPRPRPRPPGCGALFSAGRPRRNPVWDERVSRSLPGAWARARVPGKVGPPPSRRTRRQRLSSFKIRKPLRGPGIGKPTSTRNPKARARDGFSRSKIVTVGTVSLFFRCPQPVT